MNLTGIALVPPVDVCERVIRFQHEHRRLIDGPELGHEVNRPHISVLQCPFGADLDREKTLHLLRDSLAGATAEMTLGAVYYQTTAWIFADIRKDPWLVALQAEALQLTSASIDRGRIAPRSQPDLTPLEQANYDQYGYRYVGESFRPHITLGRTPARSKSLPVGLLDAYERSGLAGMAFQPTTLAFYRAGESGAYAETLASVEINAGA